MSNREPTISIDVKYNLVRFKGNESEHPFDKETFDAVLTITISMRPNIYQTAGKNSFTAQKQQRRDYNRCHPVPNEVQIGSQSASEKSKKGDRW